jgi:hypothetical protein
LAINCKNKKDFIIAINFKIIEQNMIKIAEKTDFKYYMKNGGGIFLNLVLKIFK